MVDTAKKFDTSPRVVTVASEVHFWTSFGDRMLESPNSIEFMSSKEYSTPQWVDGDDLRLKQRADSESE
jgi:hypothetical protein